MTVRFVFQGYRPAEIAHLLNLSVHTIRGYITDVGHIPRVWNAPDKGRFYLFEAARIQMRMPVEDLHRLGAVKDDDLWWKPAPPRTAPATP
jgi:hypothetical protein